MAYVKDEPVLDDSGKFHRYLDRGYPMRELYYGIDNDNIYSFSSSSGYDMNFQNELKDIICNTPYNKKMLEHLTIVDRIEVLKEYLLEDIWFSFEQKDGYGFKTKSLIKEFEWDKKRELVTFKHGYQNTQIKFQDIKKMYYPRPKKENARLDKALELLAMANVTLNNKEIKDFLNS